MLGRIREILEGQAHADMAPLDVSVDGCCGHADNAKKAAASKAPAGEPSADSAAGAGPAAACAAAAEEGLGPRGDGRASQPD